MPQTETVQASPEPRYTILVIQHQGAEEPEMALDRGTAEEAKAFIVKVQAELL